jgi:hypothetical protein
MLSHVVKGKRLIDEKWIHEELENNELDFLEIIYSLKIMKINKIGRNMKKECSCIYQIQQI